MWLTNIENAADAVAAEYGSVVAKSVFQRYGARGTYDLSPCYYSEVFADLELYRKRQLKQTALSKA